MASVIKPGIIYEKKIVCFPSLTKHFIRVDLVIQSMMTFLELISRSESLLMLIPFMCFRQDVVPYHYMTLKQWRKWHYYTRIYAVFPSNSLWFRSLDYAAFDPNWLKICDVGGGQRPRSSLLKLRFFCSTIMSFFLLKVTFESEIAYLWHEDHIIVRNIHLAWGNSWKINHRRRPDAYNDVMIRNPSQITKRGWSERFN
jgi:hypothetical protein